MLFLDDHEMQEQTALGDALLAHGLYPPLSAAENRTAGLMMRMLRSPVKMQCIACLRTKFLDRDGLCVDCDPVSHETRVALLALLQPTKEAMPQETK